MNIDIFLEIELLERVEPSIVILLLTTGRNQLSRALTSTAFYMDRGSEATTWDQAVSIHTRMCCMFHYHSVTSPRHGVVVVSFMCWSETALVSCSCFISPLQEVHNGKLKVPQ
jgi:hypothetical protein